MRAAHGSASDARAAGTGLRAMWSVQARRRRYLRVEAALAQAQAACGVIPAEAAAAIAAAADLEAFDIDRVDAEQARTGHVMVPLVAELARVVGDEHGGWVHWGATTQNIQQTADVLAIRDAHTVITGLVRRVLSDLADLADAHAGTVMAGRTHHQQAVPITFGFKVAGWADSMLRHLQRLECLPSRLFVAMAGGAAGTFAAMGPRGPDVQDRLAAGLGLVAMPVPSRGIADPFAEMVSVLALMSTATSSVAEEISLLAGVEYGELAEALPDGDVGSSTMPQKRNAKLCAEIVTIGAQMRALVPLALEAAIHSHEVDGARTAMMDEAVEQVLVLAGDALTRMHEVLDHLQVFPDRMRSNLDLTGGAIMAETLMMALAGPLGRQRAHEVVHHAATTAALSGRPFTQVIESDAAITAHLTAAQIVALLDPSAHPGHSRTIAVDTARRVRAALAAATI